VVIQRLLEKEQNTREMIEDQWEKAEIIAKGLVDKLEKK